MMAGRRGRRRPLIRSDSMMAVLAGNGGSKRNQTLKNERRSGQAAVLESSVTEPAYTTPLSRYVASAPQLELSRYLRQLSTLHDAGVLTDEEFLAARGRLFGS